MNFKNRAINNNSKQYNNTIYCNMQWVQNHFQISFESAFAYEFHFQEFSTDLNIKRLISIAGHFREKFWGQFQHQSRGKLREIFWDNFSDNFWDNFRDNFEDNCRGNFRDNFEDNLKNNFQDNLKDNSGKISATMSWQIGGKNGTIWGTIFGTIWIELTSINLLDIATRYFVVTGILSSSLGLLRQYILLAKHIRKRVIITKQPADMGIAKFHICPMGLVSLYR